MPEVVDVGLVDPLAASPEAVGWLPDEVQEHLAALVAVGVPGDKGDVESEIRGTLSLEDVVIFLGVLKKGTPKKECGGFCCGHPI